MVLLDAYMPVCDGFEFLRRRREDELLERVPVIVTTASNTKEDEIRALELGANDFVTKPYNYEVVKNRINNVIRLRETASMLNQLERDDTTLLFSKEFFFRYAHSTMVGNPDQRYDIICSDIENFKTLNDRYGRERCDQLLRQLAQVLSAAIPGMILGGRIGGDVFAFLVRHRQGNWDQILVPDIHKSILSNMVVKYGICLDADPAVEVSTICDRATIALKGIKGQYGVYTAAYDEMLGEQLKKEHIIVESMERALEEEQFLVYFQPKHDLHTNATGGAEALVRWIHPELGFVSPGVFIPIFERNGFITKLDFYIWEKVCLELRRSIDQGLPLVPVSVNASRLDFDVPDLAERITAMADRYGIAHSLLHIELTESAYAENPRQITETLEKLHAEGFCVELDDFGAGYSSLSVLGSLPLSAIKLDMSLIRQASSSENFSVLRFAIQLADGMRLKTVAEGVETAEQVAALRVLGCDYIQGYFFSRPLPQQDYENYLKEESARLLRTAQELWRSGEEE
jgi:diguanylate cyclase (GGDEF)-like protein